MYRVYSVAYLAIRVWIMRNGYTAIIEANRAMAATRLAIYGDKRLFQVDPDLKFRGCLSYSYRMVLSRGGYE